MEEMEWTQNCAAIPTVMSENMSIVYDTIPHLIGSPLRWSGLNRAAMHLKNRTIAIPRMTRVNGVSKDGRLCGCECLIRTIYNRTDKISDEPGLLFEVQTVRDPWSVRVIRPWL